MAAPKGNKFALGNNGGKPPKFEAKKHLEEFITQYFESCKPEYDKENNIVSYNYPTTTGLALYLGFASRQSLYDYKDKKEYSYIIKRAITVIESHYEERLNFQGSTGAIFALKNMGWKDKQEIENTNMNLNLTDEEVNKWKEKNKDLLDDY